MNRREFACFAAFAGALPAESLAQHAATPPGRIPDSAGLITEMVFLDDCVRIAMYDSSLSGAAKSALAGHPEAIRNGALLRSGIEPETTEQFALATGRLLSAALNARRGNASAGMRLYQDAVIVRDLAAAAGCDASSSPGAISDLLELLHMRARLGLHTLNPDGEDIHGWIERLVVWWKEQHELLTALAEACASPDTGRMRLVSEFYSAKDPLVRLARHVQFGRVSPRASLSSAIEQAPHGSQYARALADGLRILRKWPQEG